MNGEIRPYRFEFGDKKKSCRGRTFLQVDSLIMVSVNFFEGVKCFVWC